MPTSPNDFPNLPDDATIRASLVAALFDCSPSTIWRHVRLNKFPKPIRHFDRVTAWRVGDIRRALSGADLTKAHGDEP
jgi:predicted DNA-binding transcriptional regulator AlpA